MLQILDFVCPPELDSIEMVRSQVVLQEFQEPESSETVIVELISEPSGSKFLSENKRVFHSQSRNKFGETAEVTVQNQRYWTLDFTLMMKWFRVDRSSMSFQ